MCYLSGYHNRCATAFACAALCKLARNLTCTHTHTHANPQAKCCNHHCWHIPINWSLSTPRRSSLVLWGGSSGAGIVRVSKVLTTPFRMLRGDQGKRGSFISLISQHNKQNPLGVYARMYFVPERKLHTKTLVIQLWDNNPPKVTLTQKTS